MRINYKCINKPAAPGYTGGYMCMCPKCKRKRHKPEEDTMKLLLEKYTKDGGHKEYPLEQSCKSVVISDCNGIPRIKITDDLEIEYLTHGKRLHKETR